MSCISHSSRCREETPEKTNRRKFIWLMVWEDSSTTDGREVEGDRVWGANHTESVRKQRQGQQWYWAHFFLPTLHWGLHIYMHTMWFNLKHPYPPPLFSPIFIPLCLLLFLSSSLRHQSMVQYCPHEVGFLSQGNLSRDVLTGHSQAWVSPM